MQNCVLSSSRRNNSMFRILVCMRERSCPCLNGICFSRRTSFRLSLNSINKWNIWAMERSHIIDSGHKKCSSIRRIRTGWVSERAVSSSLSLIYTRVRAINIWSISGWLTRDFTMVGLDRTFLYGILASEFLRRRVTPPLREIGGGILKKPFNKQKLDMRWTWFHYFFNILDWRHEQLPLCLESLELSLLWRLLRRGLRDCRLLGPASWSMPTAFISLDTTRVMSQLGVCNSSAGAWTNILIIYRWMAITNRNGMNKVLNI